MAVSNEFSEFVHELLSGLGDISIRRMFGGAGVYHDGLMFGLIANEVLYLKADANTTPDFEAEGMGPFIYEGKGKPVALPYWEVPEYLLDDPEQIIQWAQNAHQAARRAAAKKTKKPKKK